MLVPLVPKFHIKKEQLKKSVEFCVVSIAIFDVQSLVTQQSLLVMTFKIIRR